MERRPFKLKSCRNSTCFRKETCYHFNSAETSDELIGECTVELDYWAPIFATDRLRDLSVET